MPSPRALRATTTAAAPAALAAVALSLAGCATAARGSDAAHPDLIAERASAVGIAPDLVFAIDVDGYELAPQSVSPVDAEGMSATWFNETTGAMLTIRTDRGEMTASSCAKTPLWNAPPDEPVTCTDEDGIWHRTAGGIHEYIAVRDGALVQVIGMNNAPTADLLAAARAVRVPSDAELGLLFSDLPTGPAEPVERGDLPENGDGAPIDPVGPGG